MTFLSFMIDAALRGLVVAALIGAVLALVPGLSATLRLRAWTVVLYAVLALPIVGLVTPAWRWPVAPVPVFSTLALAPGLDAVGSPAAAAIEIAKPDAAVRSRVSIPVIATAVYVTGAFCFIFQAGLGWLFVQRLRRRARQVSEVAVLRQLAHHSRSAGLGAAPMLTESPRLFAPITMFVRRPVIVLPDDWRAWPAEQMDAVLAHEVSHVARHDALTQRLALAYRAIFWFSPLSWWLQRQLGRLAELASDESALAAGVEPVTYADALLACFVRAHDRTRRTAWHLAMARRDDADAARRIERILSWKGGPSMTRTRMVLAGVGVVLAPLTVLAASVRFAPEILPAIVVPAQTVNTVSPLPAPQLGRVDAAVTREVARSVAKPAAVDSPAVQTPVPQVPAEPQKPEDDFLKGAYEDNTADLVKPKMVTWVAPKYTPDAMRQKLQGTVVVDAIVAADGTVSKVRIKVSLDKTSGLDEAALEAARKWTFTPGTLQGEAVPVHVVLQLEFRLH